MFSWKPVVLPTPVAVHDVDGHEVTEYEFNSKSKRPHSSIYIRRAHTLEHYEGVIEVQKKAWMSGNSLTDVMSMRNINNRSPGGLLLVMTQLKNARKAENVVGFAYSWATTHDEQQMCDTYIFSDLVGVAPSEQGNGFASMLKAEQRRYYLKWWDSEEFIGRRGTRKEMKWTVLPVLTLNHNLNFSMLGAHCSQFYSNVYGEIDGGLYGGLPSDRILMTWDLENPQTLELTSEPNSMMDCAPEGPKTTRLWGNVAQNSIYSASFPLNFQSIKIENFGLAKAWQTRICECIEMMLASGYYVAGFKKEAEHGKFIFLPKN